MHRTDNRWTTNGGCDESFPEGNFVWQGVLGTNEFPPPTPEPPEAGKIAVLDASAKGEHVSVSICTRPGPARPNQPSQCEFQEDPPPTTFFHPHHRHDRRSSHHYCQPVLTGGQTRQCSHVDSGRVGTVFVQFDCTTAQVLGGSQEGQSNFGIDLSDVPGWIQRIAHRR